METLHELLLGIQGLLIIKTEIKHALEAHNINMSNIPFYDYHLKIAEIETEAPKEYMDTTQIFDYSNFWENDKNANLIGIMDTSNAISMNSIFKNSKSITELTLNTLNCESLQTAFRDCSNIGEITFLNTTAKCSFFTQAFYNSYSLSEIMGLSFKKCTTADNAFYNCQALTIIDLLETPQLRSMNYMFYMCIGLKEIKNLNTSTVITMDGAFGKCKCIKSLVLNCQNVTSIAGAFDGCNDLESLILTDITVSFSIKNCKLSADSLNTMFNNLGTVLNKTIDITGNHGAATCDIIIATQKGWNIVNG